MARINTPEYIRKLECKLTQSLTPQERGTMAMKMIEMDRAALRNRLRRKYPLMPEAELKGEMFRSLYRDKFSGEKMEKIIAGIVDWHQRNPDLGDRP